MKQKKINYNMQYVQKTFFVIDLYVVTALYMIPREKMFLSYV